MSPQPKTPHTPKTLKVTPQGEDVPVTIEGETIEHALRDLAKKVKKGDLTTPLHLEFEGPSGLTFNIDVTSDEQASEFQTMGFMF